MAEKAKVTNTDSKNKIYLVIAVIVVLMVGAAVYYFAKAPKQEIIINNTNVTPTEEPLFKTLTIDITATGFSPKDLTINNGDTIVWINSDSEERRHTITSIDRSNELHSLVLNAGQNYTHRFTSTGTFLYWSEVHPEYKGSVKVE